ncbi:MAG TPA: hypothetical protein VKY22_22085 [Bradyrhizobium sp.]|nr:hypothetical protein [Bradyrhizobium sp.]
MLMHLPIVIAAALPLSPVADSVPQLDIARECRAEVGDQAAARKNCIEDDDQARQQLEKEWPTFNAAERQLCVNEARMGGASSYAEFLTCLEMSRDTRTGQRTPGPDVQNQATTGQAGPPRGTAGK